MKKYLAVLLLISLSACSWFEEKKVVPLEGERKPVLQNEDVVPPQNPATPKLDDAADITAWPQANQNPIQTGAHANFTPAFEQTWQTDIGDGYEHRMRMTARLVGSDGKIFAMDANGRVTAMDAKTGDVVWKVRTRKHSTDTLAGGMAVMNDKIYVTDGFPEIQALDITNGGQVWRTELDAPARSAPVVWDGRVFVTSRGDQAYGIDAGTGKIIWQNHGLQELAGVLSGAAPAVDDDAVFIPYMSGELIALSPGNGSVLWNETVAGVEKNDNLSSLHDLRAPPMIAKDTVIAANFSSTLTSIEKRLGDRVWSKNIGGASQSMTLSGDTVFLITVNQQLMAVSKDTGDLFWTQSLLPKLEADKSNQDEVEATYWYGPLLLNGQLLIISADGHAELRDALNGTVVKTFEDLPPPAENPIAMNSMIYWTTTDGDVVAYK